MVLTKHTGLDNELVFAMHLNLLQRYPILDSQCYAYKYGFKKLIWLS